MFENPILTGPEACKFLRLDHDHTQSDDQMRALQRLVQSGRLRPVKGCGKSHKFWRDELIRFAREQTQGAGDSSN